jgi:hypothetical protein
MKKNMYKFNEDTLKYITDAYKLLDLLEVKGIQNVNILGNTCNYIKQFFEALQKYEEDEGIIIDNTKEEKIK